MKTTAFALAGLGGFNAHGAGFLQAATECAVVPDIVTATSGQIVVLADWLQGKDLETSLIDPTLARSPLAQLTVALAGEPGVFRPAYQDAIMRWWTPPRRNETTFEALLDRLVPAQVYVPTRDAAEFETIADTLNNHARLADRDIGVVFDTYNLQTGTAVLFGNEQARRLWPKAKAIPQATKSAGVTSRDRSAAMPELLPITPEAIQSALWLSMYGFDKLPQPHLIDGAYFRSCIVAELHEFDKIFVARPLAEGWLGRPPGNWFEVQDWQTEMWFSVGYKAEVDALHNINGLVAQGALGAPFKIVNLIEVAPRTPAGFFNYFIERQAIYERARDEAIKAFRL
ncbi:MAG TPA: hypothetical protein VGC09_04440 [Rhodopila sp.]